jgi:hypothetical protein
LKAFIADPTPTLRLLEILKDDPALYVQRSVANHLNDIAKDHPARILDLLAAWQNGASPQRLWITRHALRSLVKAGDGRALAILGYAGKGLHIEGLGLQNTTLHLGDTLRFSFTLHNPAEQTQTAVVDYRLHFMKANGQTSPKVFKLKNVALGPGESLHIEKGHPLRPISTRNYYPGRHRVEVQVNGVILAGADFDFLLP